MSPVATETPTPGWGLGPTPAYTVIYTGKLHHDRGRYPPAKRPPNRNAFDQKQQHRRLSWGDGNWT